MPPFGKGAAVGGSDFNVLNASPAVVAPEVERFGFLGFDLALDNLDISTVRRGATDRKAAAV